MCQVCMGDHGQGDDVAQSHLTGPMQALSLHNASASPFMSAAFAMQTFSESDMGKDAHRHNLHAPFFGGGGEGGGG